MAAAYRDSTTASTGAGTAGSLTINVPAATVAGDTLFAFIEVDGGGGATVSTPTGWVSVDSINQSTNAKSVVFWRIATNSEPASYNFSFDTTRAASGLMAAYSGGYPYLPQAFTQSNNATGATAFVIPAASSNWDTGLAVCFLGARNTTAASSFTQSSNATKRADVCNTASPFMNCMVEDNSKGLPIGGVNVNNATCSQTATACSITVFLADNHTPSFTVSDIIPAGSATTSVASFAMRLLTNVNNVTAFAFISINKDVQTVSSITASGLTWVLVSRSNAANGSVEIWRTFVATPTLSVSTINFSANVLSANSATIGIVGADMSGTNGSGAVGAVSTGTFTTAAPSISVTTTRNNSWVLGGFNFNAAAAGTITPGANQTNYRSQSDGTNAAASVFLRQNAVTASSGTSVTMNTTAPSTNSGNMIALEILPSVNEGGLMLMGMGN